MTRPLAALALVVSALVFVATLVAPDTASFWPTPVQALSGAASVYLVITLEILKLRTERLRELFGTGVSAPEEAVVDEGVAVELETGSFPAVDPETGEFAVVEPEPDKTP